MISNIQFGFLIYLCIGLHRLRCVYVFVGNLWKVHGTGVMRRDDEFMGPYLSLGLKSDGCSIVQ